MKNSCVGSQIILTEIEQLKERIISKTADNLTNCSVNNVAIVNEMGARRFADLNFKRFLTV